MPIGFNKVGTRDVLDIEVRQLSIFLFEFPTYTRKFQECPIATDVINQRLGPMRSEILSSEASHLYISKL